MRTRTSLIACIFTFVLVAVTAPLAAARAPNDHGLVIGVRLTFDSSTHAAGSFAACCAVNDDGSAEAHISSFTPTSGDKAIFEATNTYTGAFGSFTIQLNGVTGPLDSQRHVARAHWTVISGSGAYASLHGDGRLTAVTDEKDRSLAAVANGEAHGA